MKWPTPLKQLCAIALTALLLVARGRAADPAEGSAPAALPAPGLAVRFEHLDVYLDAGDKSLAAYQIELTPTAGDVLLTGLEGGEHPAFRPAPYYDEAALHQAKSRVIVAAFNTGADLPRGKTRVARLHLLITGPVEPEWATKLQAAASADGKPIDAQVTISSSAAARAATKADPTPSSTPDTSHASGCPTAPEGALP